MGCILFLIPRKLLRQERKLEVTERGDWSGGTVGCQGGDRNRS